MIWKARAVSRFILASNFATLSVVGTRGHCFIGWSDDGGLGTPATNLSNLTFRVASFWAMASQQL